MHCPCHTHQPLSAHTSGQHSHTALVHTKHVQPPFNRGSYMHTNIHKNPTKHGQQHHFSVIMQLYSQPRYIMDATHKQTNIHRTRKSMSSIAVCDTHCQFNHRHARTSNHHTLQSTPDHTYTLTHMYKHAPGRASHTHGTHASLTFLALGSAPLRTRNSATARWPN